MSVPDAAGKVAVLTALRDAIAEELADAKLELSVGLGALHREHGTDRVSAQIPGGEKVGSIAWIMPGTRFRVNDEAAFAEWVLTNHPSEVRTVLQVRAVWQTVFLKEGVAVQGTAAVDRETGEVVPGVEAFESAAYPRLNLGTDGRGQIANAWREGRINTRFLAVLPPRPTDGGH